MAINRKTIIVNIYVILVVNLLNINIKLSVYYVSGYGDTAMNKVKLFPAFVKLTF